MKLPELSVITIAQPHAASSGTAASKAEPSVNKSPWRKPQSGLLTHLIGPSELSGAGGTSSAGSGKIPRANVSPTPLEKARALCAQPRRKSEACCLRCPSVAKTRKAPVVQRAVWVKAS